MAQLHEEGQAEEEKYQRLTGDVKWCKVCEDNRTKDSRCLVAGRKFSKHKRQKMQNRINRSGFTIVEIMIVVAIVGLIASIAIPSFTKARKEAQLSSIINKLRIIEGAKNQWAIDNKKGADAIPAPKDLTPYLHGGKMPPPIVGETYAINSVGEPPTATLPPKVQLGTYGLGAKVSIP